MSLIYDWCYDLLTESQKQSFIEYGLYYAGSFLEIGWPPVTQNGWGGHGSESQLLRNLLAFGIATYDERPYIYNTVVGRLEQDYLPQRRDFLLNAHRSLYGSGYGPYRNNYDVAAIYLLKDIYGGNFWQNDEIHYLPYWYIYGTRPDSFYFVEGDGRYFQGKNPKDSRRPDYLYIMLANYYKDGLLKYMFTEEQEDMLYDYINRFLKGYAIWLCLRKKHQKKKTARLKSFRYILLLYPTGIVVGQENTVFRSYRDTARVRNVLKIPLLHAVKWVLNTYPFMLFLLKIGSVTKQR
jgi:hypothetical protein